MLKFNLKSGRRDLNPRLSAPKADALPGCATPRNNFCIEFFEYNRLFLKMQASF